MNLELLNNIIRKTKESNIVENFIKELSEFMERNMSKEIKNTKEQPIVEQILEKRKASIGKENEITFKEEDIIKEYAERTKEKGNMYYIKREKDSTYEVWKEEDGRIERVQLNKNEIPEGAEVNSILREKNEQYILDEESTKEVIKEIEEMANEILDRQDNNLNEYRKEGNLYMVTEEINDARFLWDLTEAPEYEFEEVNFPKELLEKATQGMVFIYSNGEYKYYSDDGFERAEEIRSKKDN